MKTVLQHLESNPRGLFKAQDSTGKLHTFCPDGFTYDPEATAAAYPGIEKWEVVDEQPGWARNLFYSLAVGFKTSPMKVATELNGDELVLKFPTTTIRLSVWGSANNPNFQVDSTPN